MKRFFVDLITPYTVERRSTQRRDQVSDEKKKI